MERWRKLWATPRKLTQAETEEAFEDFQENFVRRHMRKMFLKSFGFPRAQFGVRFFNEDVFRQNWKTRLSNLLGVDGGHVEVTIIYATPDALEAHTLRGERRRSLRDIVIDDWQSACAIIRSPSKVVYLFVEEKMNGCLTRTVFLDGEEGESEEELVGLIEHDADIE